MTNKRNLFSKWSLKILTVALLSFSSTLSYAEVTTLKDVTIDVPAGFQLINLPRGIELKSPDESVFLLVEAVKPDQIDAVTADFTKFWDENKVVTNGDGLTTSRKNGDIGIETADFDKATCNGEPTVLRLFTVGPFGKDQKKILVTYWASPSGDKTYWSQVSTIIDTLSVKM